MSITFDHVNIVTDDLERTTEFFVSTFGFTAGTPTPLEGAWVDELNGYTGCKATYVSLAPPPIGSPPTPAPTHIEVLTFVNPPSAPAAEPLWAPNHLGYRHICLDVPDIQGLYEELSPTWKFLSKPVVVPAFDVTTVYFIGPGNVLIQLTQKNTSGAADA